MAAADEYVVDFPTLWIVPDWIEAHCPIPDGDLRGQPLVLYDWQLWCTVNHYRVRAGARPAGERKPDGSTVSTASAFVYRRSQVIAPQKTGKGPWSAAIIASESCGPVRFAGWAKGGEVYRCADHGCGCGWEYEYSAGEPMGKPWPTPLIQLLATAEDQTDNVYRPLQSMIRLGPLADLTSVGEEFIRVGEAGRIDVVTSSATARLGNPITFALQDETGLYTATNRMVRVAETQRRGLAGMGGRMIETTNPPDPTEDSTAKRTLESKAKDIFRFWRPPPAGLDYRKKADRRKIHRYVYAGSLHVDLDAIEAEAAELLEKDPAQAERFFGNRMAAGVGVAFDADRWRELARPDLEVPAGELVVAGVDGARFRDALAIIATGVESGHQWRVDLQERPDNASDDYEHDLERADQAMLDLFDRWDVWRVYVDPQYIEPLVERWQGRWGDKKIVTWGTYRRRPIAFALRRFRAAITAGELTHDGDPDVVRHIANAVKRSTNMVDDDGHPLWLIDKPAPERKIDAAMASCLAWECRGDAVAAGAKRQRRYRVAAY